MKGYLMGIVAAAFLVSLLRALGGSGAGEGMRRLVGGLLLTLAVFRPLGTLELTIPDLREYQLAAEAAVSDGIAQAEDARIERISADLGAYILTKAAQLGLEPEVQVIRGEGERPECVVITATASPDERQRLTGVIVRELGIEREAVSWIDPYQSSESMPSSQHTNTPS